MPRKGPTRHLFVEDVPADIDPITKVEYCGRCHLPSTNAIHNVPPPSDDWKALEARKVGDKD